VTARWPILAIFILSGAAGLVYEVVWARQLVLVFGNTTQAVSAILTGFFSGMAIGSAWGGRLADRVARPLRLYGILELILVVVVLATPLTFRLLHEVYRGAFGFLESNPGLLTLVRFGLSLLALGPATILMGATLPTLTRYLTRDPTNLSAAFGNLYAANTIGAIIGTIVAGFVLIELLGLSGTLTVGALCSATAGIVALIIDRGRDAILAPAKGVTGRPQSNASAVSEARLRLALAVSFASGFTSLGYQMLWMRLLASGTGNSTYVFTTILAVFLIGLAAGAVTYNWMRPRITDTIGLLAQGQLVIAMLVVIITSAWIAKHLGVLLNLTHSFSSLFSEFLYPITLVVLPATFVMGLTFPAISALVADPEGRVATNAGLLLSANTLGAIAGTFLIPFFVIPGVGSPMAIALLALVNLGVAIALAVNGDVRVKRTRIVVGAFGATLVVAVVAAIFAGRTFVDPGKAAIEAGGGRVFESREDEIASVNAGELGLKQIWVTGVSMSWLTVDAKLMPILPLILRPQSRTELTVAFGLGSAYRAALNAGLNAEAVELVPSVPKMFRWFYPDAAQVLANPRGRVIIADGRNHVELTDRKYDIIVTDPPPPIESSGVSVISSREYFVASRARLNQGGVAMQWVPYGQASVDEFKAFIRTFRDVFSHVIVAFGPGNNGFYMLGSDDPLAFDIAAVREVLSRPGIVDDLSSAHDSPVGTFNDWARLIPTLVWIQGDQVAAFAGNGRLITDDRPLPEYFLLRHLFGAKSPPAMPDDLRRQTANLTAAP
jgi:spermidine synthase